jgi:uncharacterized membrane protein YfhO
VLSSEANIQKIESVMSDLTALNMLNTKYFIIMSSNGPVQIQNPYRLGNAWFVENIEMVESADDEIIAVGEINPANTMVLNKEFSDEVAGKSFAADSSSTIILTDYKANHLTYESNAASEKLAVFSEVYYPNGWNAYIDGQKAPHFRANWILRAMIIPAGQHTIEFKFEPAIYSTGENISLISSILLLLLLVAYGIVEVRKAI